MKIKEIQAAESELAAMTTIEEDHFAAVKERNELVVKIHDLKEEKAKMEGDFKESELLTTQDELTNLTLKERQANEILATIKAELHQVQRAKEKKEHKYKELEEAKKELLSLEKQEKISSLIKDAFGNRGIKTVAIDYLLPKLEDKVNEVLEQLSDFRIHLDSQRASVDGEGVVEGLFITVMTGNGAELDVGCLSGGERTKVIVAFSEALASLQKCGWRLLDESLTALDSDSLESFLEALRHLQKKYPQVLCISHVPEVKEAFESSIRCTKRGGVTNIE
jgi:exonuclease SbcC